MKWFSFGDNGFGKRMKTLPEIKDEVERLAARINAPDGYLPTYGRTEDFARPRIEADKRGYHFVVVERGQEIERVTTDDLDEILFNVFNAVTFTMASDYELKHRIKTQDCRRILFGHQVNLLRTLSPKWGEREARNHERILKDYPFDIAEQRMNETEAKATES